MHLTDCKPTSTGRYWWAPLEDPEAAILVRVSAERTWCPPGEVLQVQALEEHEPLRLPRRGWLAVTQVEGLWSSEPLPEPPTEVRTSALPT